MKKLAELCISTLNNYTVLFTFIVEEYIMVKIFWGDVRFRDFLFSCDLFKLLYNCQPGRLICILLLVGFNFYGLDVYSAFEKKDVGASSFALGNAAVAIDEFPFALYYNPAALSASKKHRMAFTVQNYFGIRDLNEIDLTICFNFAGHPFSVAINRFGNRKYQEIQFTAGSRFDVIKDCAVGFSVQSYILSIKDYGQALAWGVNFAVLYNILPEITIGSMITNLNRPTISRAREQLPRTMSIGLAYYPVSGLMFSIDFFQDTRYDQELRAGCSYQVIQTLILRAGVEDQLNLHSYGLGINVEWITLDYSLRTHTVLGVSHVLTVSIVI